MTKQDSSIAKAPSGRTRRNPLTNRGKLSVARKDPNFEYRFVNDDGDNVQDKIDNGWEPVEKSETQVGDKRVESSNSEGSIVRVSVGQGKKAVLMKIPKDWYDEDQAIKQEAVDATENATKQEALSGTYGKVEITRK